MCIQQRHGIILSLVKLFHVQHQTLHFEKAIDHLERMESRKVKISRKREWNKWSRKKKSKDLGYLLGERVAWWQKWDRITDFKWKEEGMMCSLHLQQAKQEVVVVSCRGKDLDEKVRKVVRIVMNWARRSVELGRHSPQWAASWGGGDKHLLRTTLRCTLSHLGTSQGFFPALPLIRWPQESQREGSVFEST